MESRFSERLALAMKKKGVSQGDVARALRTSQPTVSRWIAGTSPRKATAMALAEFLNCNYDWLITGDGDMGRFSAFYQLPGSIWNRTRGLTKQKKLEEFGKEIDRRRTDLPARLRFVRRKLGMSINQFAQRLGCAPGYISRLENGQRTNLSFRLRTKMWEIFGINPEYLTYGAKPLLVELPGVSIAPAIRDKLQTVEIKERESDILDLQHHCATIAKNLNNAELAKMIEWIKKKDGFDDFAEGLSRLLVRRVAAGEDATRGGEHTT